LQLRQLNCKGKEEEMLERENAVKPRDSDSNGIVCWPYRRSHLPRSPRRSFVRRANSSSPRRTKEGALAHRESNGRLAEGLEKEGTERERVGRVGRKDERSAASAVYAPSGYWSQFANQVGPVGGGDGAGRRQGPVSRPAGDEGPRRSRPEWSRFARWYRDGQRSVRLFDASV